MPFEVFPYTNFHELNLDTILQYVTEIKNKTGNIDEDVESCRKNAEIATNAKIAAQSYATSASQSADRAADIYAPLAAQVNENTSDIAINSGRIDAFTQLAAGSTTGDAELMDIRVAADGTVYATAGDAVRSQVENITDSVPIVNVTSSNLFDYDNADIGYYMNASGTLVANNIFVCTNMIDVRNVTTLYCRHFDVSSGQPVVGFNQVLRFDANKQFVDRLTIGSGSQGVSSWTVTGASYVRFNIQYNASANPSERARTFMISTFYPSVYEPYHDKIAKKATCQLLKDSNDQFTINFGKCSCYLFHTLDSTTNADNWNIGTVMINSNVVIPTNTDILGPVLCNNNPDYIGGVHGDETTNHVFVSCDGESFNLSDLNHDIYGDNLIITMQSSIFDNVTQEQLFNRIVQIKFTENDMLVSNTYKAIRSCTLNRATNGGLIAAYNDIINSIAFNTDYYPSAPATTVDIANKNNVMATINTIYGSLSVRNIIGNNLNSYSGWMQVFTSEIRPRCKVYFDTYKNGSYDLAIGDIINGLFEVTFA